MIPVENGHKTEAILPETLWRLLDLDPATGALTWKRRDRAFFKSAGSCSSWNSRFAETPALNAPDKKGYLVGTILGRDAKAHRVVFAMHHGYWPVGEVDHINGIKCDNRPSNLRDVSPSENRLNQKRPSSNSSGFVGVYFNKDCQKWQAYITIDSRAKYLGVFSNISDAVKARADAEVAHGFHQNHGRAS